jgi:hypothetical protein
VVVGDQPRTDQQVGKESTAGKRENTMSRKLTWPDRMSAGTHPVAVRQMTVAERLAAADRMAAVTADHLRGQSAFSERWDMRNNGWDAYDFAWRNVGDGRVEYVRIGR